MTTIPLSRYTPLEGNFGNLRFSSSNGQPSTTPCLASTEAIRSRCVSSASDLLDAVRTTRSDRPSWAVRPPHPVRPPLLGGYNGLDAAMPHRASGLGFQAQPRYLQWFCGEPLVKPHRRRFNLHAMLQATSLSLSPHRPPTRSCLVP